MNMIITVVAALAMYLSVPARTNFIVHRIAPSKEPCRFIVDLSVVNESTKQVLLRDSVPVSVSGITRVRKRDESDAGNELRELTLSMDPRGRKLSVEYYERIDREGPPVELRAGEELPTGRSCKK